MTAYSNKDLDRIIRATDLSREEAQSLLMRYEGKPDVALEMGCGVTRVWVEPECVTDDRSVKGALRSGLRRAGEGLRTAADVALPTAAGLAIISAIGRLLCGLGRGMI